MRTSISFAKRLSAKLIRSTSILFVVVMLALIAAGYISIYKLTIKDGEAAMENSKLNMEKLLNDVSSATESAAWLMEREYRDTAVLSYISSNIVKADKNIISCSIAFEPHVLDADTEFFCNTSYREDDGSISSYIEDDESYDYHVMDWYLIPKLLNKSYWLDPEMDISATGKVVTSYSIPLHHADGSFYGVVKCDVDIHDLLTRMDEKRPYEHCYFAMIGHNASYYSVGQNDSVNETLFTIADIIGTKSARILAEKVVGGENGVYHVRTNKGYAIAFYGVMANGWSNLLVIPYSDIIAALRLSNIIFILVALLSLCLLYRINKKTISRMSKPITEFAYAAYSIGQGNFKTTIPEVHTQDELRRLSDALHYMENSIDGYITELRKTTTLNERFESELNIANQIQMQMLPHQFPQMEKIDLYAALRPAREVGGDLYDFFVKDRKLYFIVGDVSGKGVPAALYMAITKAAFRTIAGPEIAMNEVARKINNAFCSSNESGMFVTMFLGAIDLDTLELEFCNCGHNPVVIVDRDGNASFYKAIPNLVAGLFDGFEYAGESIQLESGMRLVVYTDGVTEAENKDKALYGDDRLLNFASKENSCTDSLTFIADLEKSVRMFTKSNPQNDDITVMSIRIK